MLKFLRDFFSSLCVCSHSRLEHDSDYNCQNNRCGCLFYKAVGQDKQASQPSQWGM